jgi:hypothetical protein
MTNSTDNLIAPAVAAAANSGAQTYQPGMLCISDKFADTVDRLAKAHIGLERQRGAIQKEIREMAVDAVQDCKDRLEAAKDEDADAEVIADLEAEYYVVTLRVIESIAVHMGRWQTQVYGQIADKVRSNVVNDISRIVRGALGYTLKTTNRSKNGVAPEGGFIVKAQPVKAKAEKTQTASGKGVKGAIAGPTGGGAIDVNLTNPVNAARQAEEMVKELSLSHVLSLLMQEHGDQEVRQALDILTNKPKLTVKSGQEAVSVLYNNRTIS